MKFLPVLLVAAAVWAQSTPPTPTTGPAGSSATHAQSQTGENRRVSPNGSQAARTAAVAPDEGSVSDHTYISDYFGLRYAFPAEVELREDFFGRQEDASGRSFVLFAASGASRVVGYANTVLIMADNANAAHAVDPEAYLRKLTTEQLRRQSFEPQGAPQSLTIAGHRFARAAFRKQNTFQAVAVTLLRGYAVTFMFIAPSEPELESLLRSLQSIQFETSGSAAAADRGANPVRVPATKAKSETERK